MAFDPSSAHATILFVDDDPDVLATAGLLLTRRGYRMLSARGPAEALSQIAAEPVDAILLDLNFEPDSTSGQDGLKLLEEIVRQDPKAAVVVVTGHSGVNVAVSAMRAGASDFVMKPWSNNRLTVAIEDAVARRRRTLGQAAGEFRAVEEPPMVLGDSPAIRRVRDFAARAASTPVSVLIHGETGVGKSLLARAIHQQSGSPSAPFVIVDLASAPASLVDEALFVEEQVVAGYAAAGGGDLVLDEIGGLSATLQGRLLALLTQRSRGGTPVRLIATTARPRVSLDEVGGLRTDLLEAVGTLEIAISPLRERREDIPILADHYLRLYAQRYDRLVRPLSAAAAQIFAASAWPGNVRALRQAIERGVILSDGAEVEIPDMQIRGGNLGPSDAPVATLAQSEMALVEAALKRNSFNVSRAASDLGLTRAALYRRMAKHGL